MSLRLIGVSGEDGSDIILSVTNVLTGTTSIDIWGGKRLSIPTLLDTLTAPYGSSVTTVPTESGSVYQFVAIENNASQTMSEIISVYAKVEGMDLELVDEIAAYMEDAGLGVVGQSIFKLTFPSSINECFLVLPTGGLPPDVAKCGQETLTFSLQYRSLENRPDVGYKKLSQAKRVLHGHGDILSVRRGIIEVTQAGPVFLGVDSRTKTNVHTIAFQFRGPKR